MTHFVSVAARAFTIEDQNGFAELSGDWNPMHLDPVAARRTQAGIPAVHGVHGLLWATETWLGTGESAPILGISASFDRFIGVGQQIEVRALLKAQKTILELVSGSARLMSVTLRHAPSFRAVRPFPAMPGNSKPASPPASAANLSFPQARTAAGRMEIRTGGAERWPLLSAQLGTARVEAIISLSTLVGMIVPGLHSIFSSLDLAVVDEGAGPSLVYHVADAREVYRLLDIAFAGPGVQGSLKAFVRHPPIAQASTAALRRLVRPDEFRGIDALIVGGSRGLGELTAKLLAAGGARPTIGYAVGAGDAEAVAADIRAAGAQCAVVRLDVREPLAPQLDALPHVPTQVYYFATGRIFGVSHEAFSSDALAAFVEIYVEAFANLCLALAPRLPRPARIFYPSSVAVEDRPAGMTEYAMAKAAGEILCADLPQALPGVTILTRRLPRLMTDQTASVNPTETPEGTAVMLEIVRAMDVPSASD